MILVQSTTQLGWETQIKNHESLVHELIVKKKGQYIFFIPVVQKKI